MYASKTIYKQKQKNFPFIILPSFRFVKKEKRQHALPLFRLLLAEGLAVGTRIDGGIHLVRADEDLVKGAVIGAVTVMCALGDGAFDTLVCVAVHNVFLLFICCKGSLSRNDFLIRNCKILRFRCIRTPRVV